MQLMCEFEEDWSIFHEIIESVHFCFRVLLSLTHVFSKHTGIQQNIQMCKFEANHCVFHDAMLWMKINLLELVILTVIVFIFQTQTFSKQK